MELNSPDTVSLKLYYYCYSLLTVRNQCLLVVVATPSSNLISPRALTRVTISLLTSTGHQATAITRSLRCHPRDHLVLRQMQALVRTLLSPRMRANELHDL